MTTNNYEDDSDNEVIDPDYIPYTDDESDNETEESDEDYDSEESDEDSECDTEENYEDTEKKGNQGTRWSIEDDKILLHMMSVNYHYNTGTYYYKFIANILKRTEDAIKARFVKAILYPKFGKNGLEDNIDKFCKIFHITKEEMSRYIKYASSPTKQDRLKDIIYNMVALD